jgi:surface antigen
MFVTKRSLKVQWVGWCLVNLTLVSLAWLTVGCGGISLGSGRSKDQSIVYAPPEQQQNPENIKTTPAEEMPRDVETTPEVLDPIQGRGSKATITVTSPNGWEIWGPWPGSGITQKIRWRSSMVTGNVKIELSRDSGRTWKVLFNNTPNDGEETWNISEEATAKALIRVSSVKDPSISDTSDNNFVIVGPHYKGFPGGYCTWYAAREFDIIEPSPGVNWRGDAQYWYDSAYQKGWIVTKDHGKALIGSIIVWSNKAKTLGHVAIVRGISKDTVTVAEMNWGRMIIREQAITENFGVVTTTTLSLSNLNRGNLEFIGYILPQRLIPPTLLEPSNGATNVPITVTLKWRDNNNDKNQKSYRVQVARNSNFTSPDIDRNVTTTSVTVNLRSNTRYWWRVKTIGVNGESDWSDTWSFTTRK